MLRKLLIAAVAVCASAAQAQDLYDTTVLRSLNFTFHDVTWWNLLKLNYQSQTNILADLEVEGVIYPNVGVRIRGNTSYTTLPPGSQKVSLNVEMDFVDPLQTLMGYNTLNLNNAHRDPTFCREVAYSNFLSRYIPHGRGNHVVVTLNGGNWGVYANIQQWNKDVLREWFADEDGLRIKCANKPNGPGLRYFGSSPSLYWSDYEIKDDGGLADPWGALIAVCWSVTNEPLSTWENIDDVFAIDPSIWSVVLENLFTDDDSYVHKGADFVLYRDPVDGRTHLQQTDGNESFTEPGWSPTFNFGSSSKPVLSHVLAVPELRQRYMAHMRAALTEFNWTLFDAEFTAYRNLIDAAVQADPKKLYTYSQFLTNFTSTVYIGGFGGSIVGLQQFFSQRVPLMSSNSEVSAPAPIITNVQHLPANPAVTDEVWMTAAVDGNSYAVAQVELFYKPAPGRFLRTPMLDDGLSHDGAAGDGVYGGKLPVVASAGQTVEYYVAATSSNSYGSLTFAPILPELDALQVAYTFGLSGVRISEYMYKGGDEEFFELTNTTGSPIDITGWSMDDDSAVAGTFDLSPAGVLAPGESVVVTEADPPAFAAAWGLSGVTILGFNTTANLGRNDQINIYDLGGQLVDRLSYGDESFPGSVRTNGQSGQTCHDALGINDPYFWVLSEVGDVWGSVISAGGDIGTPGSYTIVPCSGPLGSNYCVALPNQSGTIARISAIGSGQASAQNVTFHVADANPTVPGIFFLGYAPTQVPLSHGHLCVTGGTARMRPPLVTDGTGSASRPVDYNEPYSAHITAGATLYFQFWYRDQGGSNLSDGLRIDFY